MIQDAHRRWMKVAIKLLGRDSEPSQANSLSGKGDELPFLLRPRLLSECETNIYHTLQEALGDSAVICPKTRVADVVSVVHGVESFDQAARIDRKTIDFLLCDGKTFEPFAAVQVDHWDAGKNRYEIRDSYVERALQAAKLTVIHVGTNHLPSSEKLRAKLAPMMPVHAQAPLRGPALARAESGQSRARSPR